MKRRTHAQTKPKRTQPSRRFSMVMASNPKEIRIVEDFLLSVNKVAELDDGAMHRLLIASTEAVNNAILHANGSDISKKVTIRCTLTKRSLTLSVQDEGPGFNPEAIPNPLKEENLMKESGRGVFLIRSLMDEVSFRSAKKGTIVTMVLKRP